MRMHSLNRRDRWYQEDNCYIATPVARIPVVPAMAGNLTLDVKFQTAEFTKNILSGGLVSVFAFYVPNRLIWDQWIEFVSQTGEQNSITVPTNAGSRPYFFDGGDAAKSVLYRRACKLAYNQYFGTEFYGNLSGTLTAWFDVATDSSQHKGVVLNTEQFSAKLVDGQQLSVDTYPVDGPIDLNTFYKAMRNARSARKAHMSGDKYVDAMRRMGVNLDWRVQQAPEFLGRQDMRVRPVKTFNTSDTNTGKSVARYEGTCTLTTSRKRFAEHGYIVAFAMFRPDLNNGQLVAAPDGMALEREDFYLGDNLRAQDIYKEEDLTAATNPDAITAAQRFAYLRNGIFGAGSGTTDWINRVSPGNVQELAYPAGLEFPVSNELGGAHIAWMCESKFIGQTPVPPNDV